MRKKLIVTFSLLTLIGVIGFVIAPQAEAVQASGGSQLLPNKGSSCQTALKKGDVVEITVNVINLSTETETSSAPVPASITGAIYEWDSCQDSACNNPIADVLEFISCTDLTGGAVTSCVVNTDLDNNNWPDLPSAPQIIITVNNLQLPANSTPVPLVKLTKRAKTPVSSAVECGRFRSRVEIGIDNLTACSQIPGQTNICDTGQGGGSASTFFPTINCLEVTKDCTPKNQQAPGTVTFSGTVTNCGDVPVSQLEVTDSEGVPITCGLTSLEPGGSTVCSGTAECTGPKEFPLNTFTATAVPQTGGTVTKVSDPYAEPCVCECPPPGLSVVKTCTSAEDCFGEIGYTLSIENTGDVDLINCNLTETVANPPFAQCPAAAPVSGAQAIDVNGGGIQWNPPLPANGFSLPKDGTALTFTAQYSPEILPVTSISGVVADGVCIENKVEVTCASACDETDTITQSSTAKCSIPPCPPGIIVTKDCTPAGPDNLPGPVTVFGTVTNTGNTPLTEVTVVDSQGTILTCYTDNTKTTELTQPFGLDIGGSAYCEGTVQCTEGYIPADTFTASGFGYDVPVSFTTEPIADKCGCTPSQNEICRTPGFWGTHVGNLVAPGEKGYKEDAYNVTQCVINKAIANGAPGLQICGVTIDNTNIGDIDSAIEAMCVPVKGQSIRQLARQLTAASLNCVMSSGNQDCSGVSIDAVFDECNTLCASTSPNKTAITDCISKIDCFNNGGISVMETRSLFGIPMPFLGETLQCVFSENNCHERLLCNEEQGLCFVPSGPAVSDTCKAANRNKCTVVGSDIFGNNPGQCEPDGSPASVNCPNCEDSKCSE